MVTLGCLSKFILPFAWITVPTRDQFLCLIFLTRILEAFDIISSVINHIKKATKRQL